VSGARALFAAPAVIRALSTGGAGRVEFVFGAGAGYAQFGEEWVLLAEPMTPFGPLSLAVAGLTRLALVPGSPAWVADGQLVLGEAVVQVGRVRSRAVLACCASPSGRSRVAAAARAAVAALPVVPVALSEGVAALAAGRVLQGVRLLAGVGPGLTPAGDDVLAGYAAARRLVRGASAGARVRGLSEVAAGRSSPLGLAYLRCAERGELPDVGAALLAAMLQGSVDSAVDAAARVREWGASSGAAMAWGMAAAAGVASSQHGRTQTGGGSNCRESIPDRRVSQYCCPS
jgi:hypothetical protein